MGLRWVRGKSFWVVGVWSSDRANGILILLWGEHGSAAMVLGSNSLLIVAYGGVDIVVSRRAIVICLGSARQSVLVSVALERI